MSKIALSGDVSGTGAFTIAAPNGNTNRTATLPDASGTILVDSTFDTFLVNSFTGNNISQLGYPGYQKLPSGLIIQWGATGTIGTSQSNITLPITFPNTGLSAQISDNSLAGLIVSIIFVNNSTIGVRASSGGNQHTYLVLGH